MIKYWRFHSGLSRTELTIGRLLRMAKGDVRDLVIDVFRFVSRPLGLHRLFKQVAYQSGVIQQTDEAALAMAEFQQRLAQQTEQTDSEKPLIFVSACMDADNTGGWKYNGGIKEFNCLVKLLRQKGYEAYVVTYDGQYEPWLVDHQPHLSLAECQAKMRSQRPVRCVTSWAEAEAFLQICDQIYFWDMEVGFSENEHFALIHDLYKHKIQNTAAISRTIQAWHMAYFGQPCTLVPNLVDDSIWIPDELQRQPYKVGYMDEGPHTEKYVELIQEITLAQGLNLEFVQLKGPEAEILAGLQTCTVFLTMNLGKDPLWGEGGPLPPLEALATGCIPIAFDIHGPREIIQSGFNGVIVPRYRPDLMAKALVNLYQEPGAIEQMRQNALALFKACHTFEARWPMVKAFLNLHEPELVLPTPTRAYATV